VFRTYEPTRDRLVAVKVFRLDITPEQAQALADELSRAADAGLFHPSIVEPVAAGVEGTVAYRAEEYVAAESLDVAIRHYAPAPLEKVLPFITQLAGAIDFARAAGVGHGALHLRDIFLTPDEARAGGFGVVDALERVGLRAPVRRPYTAPERIAGDAWGTPADVFSLAAITFELLTGRRPSGTGDQLGSLSGAAPAEHASAVHRVLARAMDDRPDNRYPNALALASALDAASRGVETASAVAEVGAITAAVETRRAPSEELPAPSAEPPAPSEDDVLAEPEADEAHHVLLDAHAEIPHEASLFDDEGPTDLGIDVAETERFADEFIVAGGAGEARVQDEQPIEYAIRGEPVTPPDHDQTGPPEDSEEARGYSVVERPRPAALPLAMTGVLCLLLGFAAGYAVGGRDRGPASPPPPDQQAAVTAPATAPGSPSAPGKEWSEQAIAPQPSAVAPSIPNDAPPADRGSAPAPPARAGGAAAAPAATTGTIVVRSEPSRAPVTINGKWRGRTPLTLDKLPFGKYIVRVVEPGYAVAREDVTLSAGEPSRALSMRLSRGGPARPAGGASPPQRTGTPAPRGAVAGSLYVDSRPTGARVFVDGRPMGTTPARIPGVAIGSHVVRLELADHRAWTTSTRVSAGIETRVTASLDRIR